MVCQGYAIAQDKQGTVFSKYMDTIYIVNKTKPN